MNEPAIQMSLAEQPTIVIGPGLQEFTPPLQDAYGNEYALIHADTGEKLLHHVQTSGTPPVAIVVNGTAPLGRPVDFLLSDLKNILNEVDVSPRPRVIVLCHDADEAQAITHRSKNRLNIAIIKPTEWKRIYKVVADQLLETDEEVWERLNPVQRGLLKLTKRSMVNLSSSVARGEGLDRNELDDMALSIVEAGKNGEVLSCLENLRAHHSNTFGHSLKVAGFMTAFGVSQGFSRGDLQIVAQAGLCHDLGKCSVPAEVLSSPVALTEEQFELMKQHPLGARQSFLNTVGLNPKIIAAAESHHEKLDGTGYPHGLKGSEIDDLALLCAIADIYSALTEKRSYKPRFSQEKSFQIMDEMARSGHVEPAFLHAFKTMIREDQG